MKLRNKKTGEIVELSLYGIEVCISKEIQPVYHSLAELNEEWEDYEPTEPLADLNEEWEDYKPTEPLIKDKKIRKAVRAWAEANGVSKVVVAHPNFDTTILASTEDPHRQISFSNERAFLPMYKVYTIAELCGEADK